MASSGLSRWWGWDCLNAKRVAGRVSRVTYPASFPQPTITTTAHRTATADPPAMPPLANHPGTIPIPIPMAVIQAQLGSPSSHDHFDSDSATGITVRPPPIHRSRISWIALVVDTIAVRRFFDTEPSPCGDSAQEMGDTRHRNTASYSWGLCVRSADYERCWTVIRGLDNDCQSGSGAGRLRCW